MATNTAGGLRLLTEAKGRLLLVEGVRGHTDHETYWLCLSTSGHRKLATYDATCVHDGTGDRGAQVVRAVRRTVATGNPSHVAGPLLAMATRLMLDRPKAGADADGDLVLADGLRAKFAASCGEATTCAVMTGISPQALARIDAEVGADAVDRGARDNPFLASLAAAGSAMDEIPIADVRAAIEARDADAAAAAAWRLAGGMAERHLMGLALADGGEAPLRDMLALLDADDGDYMGGDEPDDEPPAPARPPAEIGPVPPNVRLLLDRVRGESLPWPLAAAAVLGCAHVPADWLPRDRDAARDFAVCAYLAERLSRHSCGALDARVLLASARGRWDEFLRRATAGTALAETLAKGDPLMPWTWHPGVDDPGPGRREVESLARMVEDMVDRFRKQVAAPAAALRRLHADPAAADGTEVSLHAPWRLLLGGKSLPAVVEAAVRWHARRAAMDDLMRTIGDARKWPRPFPDFMASNGIAAIPLLDAKSLAEEGARLRHCVADYADGCARERIVVVSLRPPAGGGAGSTAELAWIGAAPAAVAAGWGPSVLQHRTTLNGTPAAADVAALGELVAWLRSGAAWADGADAAPKGRVARLTDRIDLLAARIWGGPGLHGSRRQPPDDDGMDDGRFRGEFDEDGEWREGDPVTIGCGYDWRSPEQLATAIDAWSPFLPRETRVGPHAIAEPLGLAPWPEAAMPGGGGAARGGRQVRFRAPRIGPLPTACIRLAVACLWPRWLNRQRGAVQLLVLGTVALVSSTAIWQRFGDTDHVLPWSGTAEEAEGRPGAPVVVRPSPEDAAKREAALKAEADAAWDLHDRLARYLAMPASDCPAGAFLPVLSFPTFEPQDVACHGSGRIRVRAYGGGTDAAYVPEGLPPVGVVDVKKGLLPRWLSDAWRDRTLATMAEEGVAARPDAERVPLPDAAPPATGAMTVTTTGTSAGGSSVTVTGTSTGIWTTAPAPPPVVVPTTTAR